MVKYLIIILILAVIPVMTYAGTTNKKYDKIVAEWSRHLTKQRNAIHSIYEQGTKKCNPVVGDSTPPSKNGCYSLLLEEWGQGLKKVDTKYSKMFKIFGKNKVR